MKSKEIVSIIIPCKDVDGHAQECVRKCLDMEDKNFEILLLPDDAAKVKFPRTRVVPTGPVKPARKRNMAARVAKGSVLAFIDADAYPEKSWLSNAMKIMRGKSAGVAGGPNIIPPSDGLMQKAGDDVLSSRLGGGYFSFRYRKRGNVREVGELPTCNMLVKKKLFMDIGGFDETLLTAEDAKLCFQARRLMKKVIYSPDILVYHHRRPLFIPHMRQMWRYGRDKACIIGMVKRKEKISYAIPSLFVLFLVAGGVASALWKPLLALYAPLAGIYAAAVIIGGIVASPRRFLLVIPGIFLTHVTYGIAFVRGLLSNPK